jgi:hypothetical protein
VGSGRLKTSDKILRKGDPIYCEVFFGMEGYSNEYSAEAIERSTILWINRPDFNKVFNSEIRHKIMCSMLAMVIDSPQKQALFEKNRLNTELNAPMLTLLESLAIQKLYSSGQMVWEAGQLATFCIYISKGSPMLTVKGQPEQ